MTGAWWDYYLRGRWGNAFGIKGPAYDPVIGHRGTDRPAPAGSWLPAWEDMTVVGVGRHPIVGPYVNLRAQRDGAFLGVAHVVERSRPDVGLFVHAGDSLVQAAGHRDPHGSAWFGAHFHIVLSSVPNAAQGLGRLRDARPRIMLAASRHGASTGVRADVHSTGTSEEDDMPRTFISKDAQSVKYELTAGRKRSVSKAEWQAIRALEAQGLDVVETFVPQSVIDGIPGS